MVVMEDCSCNMYRLLVDTIRHQAIRRAQHELVRLRQMVVSWRKQSAAACTGEGDQSDGQGARLAIGELWCACDGHAMTCDGHAIDMQCSGRSRVASALPLPYAYLPLREYCRAVGWSELPHFRVANSDHMAFGTRPNRHKNNANAINTTLPLPLNPPISTSWPHRSAVSM